MENTACNDLFSVTISENLFSRLSAFIEAKCGIKMNPTKRTMVEGRLRKRLRTLKMSSFEEYCDYLFSPEGVRSERPFMIDAVTTNTTQFFREPHHFDYLVQKTLPEWLNNRGSAVGRRFQVWSAACSTGEEPYTLAMVLKEFQDKQPDFHFSILATDICTEVLNTARAGIYAEEKVQQISMQLKKKYLTRSRDKGKNLVRVSPELRALIKLQRLNFMDSNYGVKELVDVIFCRNVLIYFDRPTQEKVLNRLYKHLSPGGHMFLGHSESLTGINVPLVQEVATVYRKPGVTE